MRGDERSSMELECRFGERVDISGSTFFNSTVSFAFFNTVMTMLNEYTSWTRVIEWREITDYYFKTDMFDELRSRIEVVDGTPSVKTVHKTRSSSEMFCIEIPNDNIQMFKYVSPPGQLDFL